MCAHLLPPRVHQNTRYLYQNARCIPYVTMYHTSPFSPENNSGPGVIMVLSGYRVINLEVDPNQMCPLGQPLEKTWQNTTHFGICLERNNPTPHRTYIRSLWDDNQVSTPIACCTLPMFTTIYFTRHSPALVVNIINTHRLICLLRNESLFFKHTISIE